MVYCWNITRSDEPIWTLSSTDDVPEVAITGTPLRGGFNQVSRHFDKRPKIAAWSDYYTINQSKVSLQGRFDRIELFKQNNTKDSLMGEKPSE